ncbi:hypothetical protein ISS08_02375 [Candidatus Pacearchaeota archaeon]|nr:hypothetical protein [Candidatus Pacearchaeota archaeon]
MDKKGNILSANLVFIILNVVFIVILMLFLFSKIQNTAILEERNAKQIAMIIDSAKPGMIILLDLTKAFDKKEDSISERSIVSINNNVVTVKLREGVGYSYSFFNNVNATTYLHLEKENTYVLTISKK